MRNYVCGGMWQYIMYVHMRSKHVEDGGGAGACVCMLTCVNCVHVHVCMHG